MPTSSLDIHMHACQILFILFLNFIHTVAMNAEIRMQSATATVSEGMMSTMVCAIISGVTGNVEEAVDANLTLTGSTKAGTVHDTIPTVTVDFESWLCMFCVAQLLDKCHHAAKVMYMNIVFNYYHVLHSLYTPLELGTDFSTTDPVATFAIGALVPGCIEVEISPDMSVEGDHTFTVSLNPGPITPSLTVGTPNTTVVTITDDVNDSKYYILTVSWQ